MWGGNMSNSLMKQAFLLMIAGLIARFLGLLYQTMLSRAIGPQGLGLYQMTFTIFMAALTLASAGLSQSISKLTSEYLAKGDQRNARKIFKLSLSLVLVTSITICMLILIFAPKLAHYIYDDMRLILPFRFLTIGIFSVAISQVFQGYFQGQKYMLPTALSQILEQGIRIVSIPLLVIPLLNRGVVAATSGTVLGMGIAETIGLFVLLTFYLIKGRNPKPLERSLSNQIPSSTLLRTTILLALPIGFGSLLSTLNYSLSTIIIPRAMMLGGVTREFAVESLGYFSGMALPLVFFPTVFTFPIALSLIPGVSEALATSNLALVRKRITLATKFTIVLGFFIGLILKLYSGQLPALIFGFQDAKPIVAVLAYSTVFCYPQQIFTSILQGLGKPTLALRNLAIFTASNLFLLMFFVSRYGIIGAAYTFIVVNLLAFIIDFLTIRSVIYIKFDILDWVIKPFLAVITTYKITLLFLDTTSYETLTAVSNILLTSCIFIVTLLLSTTFRRHEISSIFKSLK